MYKTTNFESARDNQERESIYLLVDPWEIPELAAALKAYRGRILQEIKRVENNPLNDGQVTYTERLRELRFTARYCTETIEILTNK